MTSTMIMCVLYVYFLLFPTTTCSGPRGGGFFFKFYIVIYLIYDSVLVSGVQQYDLVIHKNISILFSDSFLFRLLQSIEFPVLYNTYGLIIYFIYSEVCIY